MMQIILTHEQADFDALGSLLGACLLNEKAIPVLPNRMNRNVRAFVTLYGAELPFVDRRDLPSEVVETITLVDTQSLVSVRGFNNQTRVVVIDHHPRRESLPPDWQVSIEDIGANSTLFVEALRDHNGALDMIHSTLLLLGIYEDTGSLTYSRTTSRDLRAAAFLLEQGANLGIASHFLNHPLSQQQQALYDQLRAAIETHKIHGHSVIVTCGDAVEMEEELSTIAHKLRDLLDPDALFVLVKTRSGVQMIARSTNDSIDVAEITALFGGGGHSRASASLIKDRELGEIRDELIRLLPDHIRPAITVAQIMSRGPQLLTPATPVEDAARRMQRYGYEGYPVVQAGKVVGLLTRRTVDRALAHKLNLTAASLMEAGEVVVHPGDSIEHLQRLMTDTGWGQIPVVQPKTGEIIGIVTRTDVLKTLTRSAATPAERKNFSARLDTALPPAQLALLKVIAGEAHEQRAAVYMVGGFVRDLLLGLPGLDFDLVVEGDAIALAKALSKKYGGRTTSHARFGTAKWFIKDRLAPESEALSIVRSDYLDSPGLPDSIDLITARTEFYTHPTALPTVERGSIKLDLHRRDFTINTLALRLDGNHYGELHDYWGGLADIRQGLVRVLHSLSFVDDPTRILRAVRFEQRFGFKIEERTLQLLSEALSLLDRVSGDRIRHELNHIFDERRSVQMVSRLDELKVLAAIQPQLTWDEWIRDRIEALNNFDLKTLELIQELQVQAGDKRSPLKRSLAYVLWLNHLPTEAARQVVERLRIPHDLEEDLNSARRLSHDLASLVGSAPSVVVARLDEVTPLALVATYLTIDNLEQRKLLEDYILHWRKLMPGITGHDLRERGLPPGPAYRRILAGLRTAWLDGTVTDPAQEQDRLEKLISEENTGG
ncbi:MAG: CBS domain-containing protein [Chloroflexota bacterium]|nr:MAG: CBS domain-containing protein [Chloroflexota bacterium]